MFDSANAAGETAAPTEGLSPQFPNDTPHAVQDQRSPRGGSAPSILPPCASAGDGSRADGARHSQLSEEHLQHLAKELGSEERARQLEAWGVRSLTADEAREMGFTITGLDGQRHSSAGIFFPFGQAFGQMRCDEPLRRKDGEVAKYLNRARVRQEIAVIGDGKPTLATEGYKDAAALHFITGQTVAALPGVWSWRLLPQTVQQLIYDADAVINPNVWRPLLDAGFRIRGLKLSFFDAAIAGPKGGACEFFQNGGDIKALQAYKPRALLMELPSLWSPATVRSDRIQRSLNYLLRLAAGLDLQEADLDQLAKRASQRLGVPALFGRKVLADMAAQRYRKQQETRAHEEGLSVEQLLQAHCSPEPTRRELQQFLRHTYDIRWNELRRAVELDGSFLQEIDLADAFLADRHGIEVGKDIARSTFQYIARSNSFNPVADYLAGLRSNPSELRLVSIQELGHAFGIAEDDTLSQELLARHLAAGVRRGIQPGYKHDQILILRGEQGRLKSSAIAALSPSGDWYDAVTDVKALEDREFLAKVNGAWCFEFEEVEHALSKRTAPEFKGFITRQVDRYVEKYETASVAHPRRSVLFGTTNDHEILNDHTGDRRVWIVDVVNSCDPDWIRSNRNSIWATVMTWLDWGLETYLPVNSEAAIAASERAKAARLSESWEGPVREVLEAMAANAAQENGIAQDTLAIRALGLLPASVDRNTQMRLTRLVTGAGFITHDENGTALRWVQVKRRFLTAEGQVGRPRSGYQAVPTVPTVPTANPGGWNAQIPWHRTNLKAPFQPFQPSEEVEIPDPLPIGSGSGAAGSNTHPVQTLRHGYRSERLERSGSEPTKTQATTGSEAFQPCLSTVGTEASEVGSPPASVGTQPTARAPIEVKNAKTGQWESGWIQIGIGKGSTSVLCSNLQGHSKLIGKNEIRPAREVA